MPHSKIIITLHIFQCIHQTFGLKCVSQDATEIYALSSPFSSLFFAYTGHSESVLQCNGANTSPLAVEQDLSSATTRMGIIIFNHSFSGSVA